GSCSRTSEQPLPLWRNPLDHELDPGKVGVFVEPRFEFLVLDHPVVGAPALLEIPLLPGSRCPAAMTSLAGVVVEAMQMDQVKVGIEPHRGVEGSVETRLPAQRLTRERGLVVDIIREPPGALVKHSPRRVEGLLSAQDVDELVAAAVGVGLVEAVVVISRRSPYRVLAA